MIIDGLQSGQFDRGAFQSLPEASVGGDWFQTVEDINVIPGGLHAVGFSQGELDKTTHKSWLRLYEATFAKT